MPNLDRSNLNATHPLLRLGRLDGQRQLLEIREPRHLLPFGFDQPCAFEIGGVQGGFSFRQFLPHPPNASGNFGGIDCFAIEFNGVQVAKGSVSPDKPGETTTFQRDERQPTCRDERPTNRQIKHEERRHYVKICDHHISAPIKAANADCLVGQKSLKLTHNVTP
jgi:hypothetical protein